MLEGPMAEHIRQMTARASAALRRYLPRRLRRDLPVVPVVRLVGVIGLCYLAEVFIAPVAWGQAALHTFVPSMPGG